MPGLESRKIRRKYRTFRGLSFERVYEQSCSTDNWSNDIPYCNIPGDHLSTGRDGSSLRYSVVVVHCARICEHCVWKVWRHYLLAQRLGHLDLPRIFDWSEDSPGIFRGRRHSEVGSGYWFRSVAWTAGLFRSCNGDRPHSAYSHDCLGDCRNCSRDT